MARRPHRLEGLRNEARFTLIRVVFGRLLIVAVVLAAALLSMLAAGRIDAPSKYDPFAPLIIDEEPNWLTGLKFSRVKSNAGLCRSVMAAAQKMSVAPVADRQTGENCGIIDAVRIERADVAFSPASPTLTCGLAAAWAMFERHALDSIARETLHTRIVRVEHLGVYACRNVYGRAQGRRSEHARANAIDIAAFVLADGRRIVLKQDWGSEKQPERAAFLRRVRDEACRYFNVVLGPDYNEAHRDHFHFDMGRSRVCR